MKKELTMVPVSQWPNFLPRAFNIFPDRQIVFDYDSKECMEQAREAAKAVDEVCIALFSDPIGEFVLGTYCCKGSSMRYILFNAAECKRAEADFRAVTPNTGRGALSFYWYDRWIKFEKGGIV